jgi:hypothetical protein
MIEINLIPDVKRELIKAQRIRSMVIMGSIAIGVVSVAVVTLLAIYVFTIQAVRSGLADDAINKGSAELTGVEDLTKTITIQNQLTKVSNLHSNKKIDSRIFDLLSAINPPAPNNIQVSSLTIDSESGIIAIEGQASNSYAAAEVFKKTIEGATLKYTDSNKDKQEISLASSISISNTSYGEDSSGNKVLRFNISFVYAEELFSSMSKGTSVVIVTDGNATDSYLGVPMSIFVDRAKDITEVE